MRTPTDKHGRNAVITQEEVLIVALKEEKVELSYSKMERFPQSVGFISHIHPRKSPSKKFGKGRPQNLEEDWMNLLSIMFKTGLSHVAA